MTEITTAVLTTLGVQLAAVLSFLMWRRYRHRVPQLIGISSSSEEVVYLEPLLGRASQDMTNPLCRITSTRNRSTTELERAMSSQSEEFCANSCSLGWNDHRQRSLTHRPWERHHTRNASRTHLCLHGTGECGSAMSLYFGAMASLPEPSAVFNSLQTEESPTLGSKRSGNDDGRHVAIDSISWRP